ncbi:unnamed protein product [Closterium sp. Naga37s-1]|nr:unnamed protein product [Closterium sp. Naga37s-1]
MSPCHHAIRTPSIPPSAVTAGGGEDEASLLELARQEDHAHPASAQQLTRQQAFQLDVAQAERARGHAADAAAGSGATAAATGEGGATAAAAAAVGGEAGREAGQGGQAYPDKEPQPFPERDHQQQFPEREPQPFPEREPQPFPEREHEHLPEKIPHGSGVFGEEGVVLDRPGAEEEKRTEVKASVGQGKEDEDEDGKDGDEGDEEKGEKEEKEEEEEEKDEKDAGGKSEGGQKGDEEESEEGSGEGEAGGKKEKKAGDKGESEYEEDGEDDEEDDEEEGGGKEGKKGRSEAGTGSGKKAQDEEGEKEDEEDEEEKEEEKEAKEEEEGSHSSGEGAGEEDEGAGPADDSAAGDGDGAGSEGESGSSGGGEATVESAGSSEQQSVAAKEVVSAAFPLSSRRCPLYVKRVPAVPHMSQQSVASLPRKCPQIPHLFISSLLQKAEEAAAVAADLVGEPIDVEGCRGHTKAEAAAVAADPVGERIDVEGCRGRNMFIHKPALLFPLSHCPLLPFPLSFPPDLLPFAESGGGSSGSRSSGRADRRGGVSGAHSCATLLPWFSICPHFQNDGLGNRIRNSKLLLPSGRWFETHMYALEMVFHYRLRKAYKCITSDPDKADLFFIPFYASLDVTRWHFAKNASLDDRDRMHDGLAKWLMRREHFKKRNGADHFIVLGQGSWDFRRSEGSQWGNRLLLLPEMKHVTKLVLAANLWEDTEIGIPPLTFFHPRWEKDYKTWQRIAESHRRTSLAAFASLRDAFSKHNKALGRQCKKAKACRYLECVEDICTRPEVLMDLFTDAAFCIVPSGHTGARRAAFDAIVAGCIPVFLDSFVPSQYKWHLPANSSTYSVALSEKAVLAGKVDVIKELEKIPGKEVRRMRLKIIREVLPAVVYNHPRMYPMEQKRDAFDIAMEEVVRRVQRNKQAAAAA